MWAPGPITNNSFSLSVPNSAIFPVDNCLTFKTELAPVDDLWNNAKPSLCFNLFFLYFL